MPAEAGRATRVLSRGARRTLRIIALGALAGDIVLLALHQFRSAEAAELLVALGRPQALPSVLFGIVTCILAVIILRALRPGREHLLLMVIALQAAFVPTLVLQVDAIDAVREDFSRWRRNRTSAPAVWGDGSTFDYLFPTAPPFIGTGGRLRPDQDHEVRTFGDQQRFFHLVTDGSGFRNRHAVVGPRDRRVLRVLNIGDSYSLGYGLDQEEFFGAALERELGRLGPVEVVNAEVSDPAYGLFYLQQHGLALAPDVVILGFCGNDLLQIHQFSGPGKRFLLDPAGKLVPNPAYSSASAQDVPLWESLRDEVFPGSRVRSIPKGSAPADSIELVRRLRGLATRRYAPYETPTGWVDPLEASDGRKRLVDGFTNLGQYLGSPPRFIEDWYRQADAILSAFAGTARAAGSQLVVVAFPHPLEVDAGYRSFLFRTWGLDAGLFDTKKVSSFLRSEADRHGFALADPAAGLTALSYDELVLSPGDVHYSARAYALAAATTAGVVEGSLGKQRSVAERPAAAQP